MRDVLICCLVMAGSAIPAAMRGGQETPPSPALPDAAADLLRDASLATLSPTQAQKSALFPLATVEQPLFQCGARFNHDSDLVNGALPIVFYLRDTTVNQTALSKQPGYLRIDCTCAAPGECPATGNECVAPACNSGLCATAFVAYGTPTATQVPADCKQRQCNGGGGTQTVNYDPDVPVDGNQCTSDVCTSGVPSNPYAPTGTACSQNGGILCDGTGSCVQCNMASECPGSDTECRTRTCNSHVCGINFTSPGTPASSQIAGDCRENQCDGAGNIVSVNHNSDVPVDGNQCTSDVCTGGVPSNPNSPTGTPCSQSGGTTCDGAGSCIPSPAVTGTTPGDGASAPAPTAINVTFNQAMNPATLTGQTAAGACAGSIQVSLDGFASCIAFSSPSAAMSAGNTVATLAPAPGLLVNRVFKIRVTTAAQGAAGLALPAQFTHATGFTTTSPNLCDGSVVISQLYGGGGNAGATYQNDFVELHNRGTTAFSLSGKSLQYASAAGTTWASITPLSGTIPSGGYFLVKLASNGAIGILLPTPDLSSASINLSTAAGKIALINGTTQIPDGSCPPAGSTLDFVGYGTGVNCFEGAAAAGAPSSTTADQRAQSGCGDSRNNGADFSVATPAPRNSVTSPAVCGCLVQNESGAVPSPEADFCVVQFPQTLNVQTGTSSGLVYGQIFETGVTPPAGASAVVTAQLGYGPPYANPEYDAGWQWFNTSYNTQAGNNDEYLGSFTAPGPGQYRYVYRFSLDGGMSWTYCDGSAADGGSGSLTGLTFDIENEPVLTVTP